MPTHSDLARTLTKLYPGKEWTLDDLVDERHQLLATVQGYDDAVRADRKLERRVWDIDCLKDNRRKEINSILVRFKAIDAPLTDKHFDDLIAGQRITWYHDGEIAPTLAELEAQYDTIKADLDAEDAKRGAHRRFFQLYSQEKILAALKGDDDMLKDMQAQIAVMGL